MGSHDLLLSHASLCLDAKLLSLLFHLFELALMLLHLRHILAGDGCLSCKYFNVIQLLGTTMLVLKFCLLLF